MKIKELKIKEHQTVNLPKNFSFLEPALEKKILSGQKLSMPLKMSYGDFDIYKKDDIYGVIDSNKKLLLVIGLSLYKPNIYQMKKFERVSDPKINTSDMAAALFHYLIQDLNIQILSDTVMSTKANEFWQKIIQRHQCPIFIWDDFTNKEYPSFSAGQLTRTSPKVKILDPIEDLGDNDFDINNNYISRKSHRYRFYWFASQHGMKNRSHYNEQFINEGYEPSWILFGEQDYPNDIR